MGLTSSVEKFADLARGKIEAMAGLKREEDDEEEEEEEEEEGEHASILRRANLESVCWAISLCRENSLFCFFLCRIKVSFFLPVFCFSIEDS